jgi:hypothetical protein
MTFTFRRRVVKTRGEGDGYFDLVGLRASHRIRRREKQIVRKEC